MKNKDHATARIVGDYLMLSDVLNPFCVNCLAVKSDRHRKTVINWCCEACGYFSSILSGSTEIKLVSLG